jgi:hypothetical protein
VMFSDKTGFRFWNKLWISICVSDEVSIVIHVIPDVMM